MNRSLRLILTERTLKTYILQYFLNDKSKKLKSIIEVDVLLLKERRMKLVQLKIS